MLVRGTCSGASSSKLKLSEEDGRIEVEFEVDQNRNDVRWTVSLRRVTAAGPRLLASGTRITRAPSGSFEFRRVVADRAGADTIRARATRAGEVCSATAVFPARAGARAGLARGQVQRIAGAPTAWGGRGGRA